MDPIEEENVRRYLAQDGLMCIRRYQTPPKTADNDNGILFLTLFYLNRYLAGDYETEGKFNNEYFKDRSSFMETLGRLKVPDTPLTHRNPGRYSSLNSHDNLVGHVIGAVVFNLPDEIEAILTWGIKTGFTFNNQRPDTYRVRAWVQGSEISFLKLCRGYVPTLFQSLWWGLSVLYNAIFQLKHKFLRQGLHHSEAQLLWARQECLMIQKKRYERKLNKFHYFGVSILKDFWDWRKRIATLNLGYSYIAGKYFRDSHHPVVTKAKQLPRGV